MLACVLPSLCRLWSSLNGVIMVGLLGLGSGWICCIFERVMEWTSGWNESLLSFSFHIDGWSMHEWFSHTSQRKGLRKWRMGCWIRSGGVGISFSCFNGELGDLRRETDINCCMRRGVVGSGMQRKWMGRCLYFKLCPGVDDQFITLVWDICFTIAFSSRVAVMCCVSNI